MTVVHSYCYSVPRAPHAVGAAPDSMMRRISKIRNRREASIEVEREELRNMRWERHKSKILTAATAISMVTVSGKLSPALHWLQGVTGI